MGIKTFCPSCSLLIVYTPLNNVFNILNTGQMSMHSAQRNNIVKIAFGLPM